MKTSSLEEFRAELKAQGVSSHEHYAFICPMCGTVQSAHDLIKAGAGDTYDAVEKYIGFSCVGRFTNAESPRKGNDGMPCNWTLGGLFQTHKFEVETTDGKKHPHFEPATPEQAREHEKKGCAA